MISNKIIVFVLTDIFLISKFLQKALYRYFIIIFYFRRVFLWSYVHLVTSWEKKT